MAHVRPQPRDVLRAIVIAAGLCWSIVFVAAGLGYGLQMYADGSIFSYAVAVQDAWAFHWRNISGRLFVYLFAFAPAELYVALTGKARGGIAVYGGLWFAAPFIGLAATYVFDRSSGRIVFAYGCASTACLCPLVFGFPTELWMSHAVFWPALALCHYARSGILGTVLVTTALLALVLTHEGGVVFALAILVTAGLREPSDPLFLRTAAALLIALGVWAAIKVMLPPDEYFGSVVVTAALMLVDPANLTSPVFLLLLGTLAGYALVFALVWRMSWANAHFIAAAIIALALIAYWLWLDRWLHTDARYALRTALLIGTPLFGGLAIAFVLRAEGRIDLPIPLLPQVLAQLTHPIAVRAATGAVALVMLVHAVETAKFVAAWTGYKAAVRALATGRMADPALGDPRFVSAARIDSDLNRLSWFSTTPYLSILLAPGLAPARLVVDPEGDYFWLSCRTASDSRFADRAVPEKSRQVLQVYNCLHR